MSLLASETVDLTTTEEPVAVPACTMAVLPSAWYWEAAGAFGAVGPMVEKLQVVVLAEMFPAASFAITCQ